MTGLLNLSNYIEYCCDGIDYFPNYWFSLTSEWGS